VKLNKTVALHYPWFKKEDINGFITLFQDNLSNFVILSISMLSMGFPASIVFGKVVPGAVIALAAGNFYHAYMANRLAKKENRTNVTPLSYGVSTGGMFIYLFGVLLPVKTLVGDPEVAWKIAVASCFFIGFLEVLVSFAGRWLKANVPRAAMLGTISGLALAVIGGEMVFGMLEVPLVGLVVFGIIFAGLLGKAVMPLKIPTTLFALILGTVLAYALGHANISELKEGLNQLGFYPFIPTIAAFEGMGMLFTTASFVIALVIPVKLYHAMETITNVESIEVLGDKYDVRECMIVDGSCTMLGTLFGGVFPTMVYLGSPAYKAMNAGRGFVILNGIAYLIAGMFGIIALISATIPLPYMPSRMQTDTKFIRRL